MIQNRGFVAQCLFNLPDISSPVVDALQTQVGKFLLLLTIDIAILRRYFR